MRAILRLALRFSVLGIAACAAPREGAGAAETGPPAPAEIARDRGVELTPAGSPEVAAAWKERMPTPYVFVETRLVEPGGGFGDAMRALLAAAAAEDLRPAGPPFGLFQHDPAGAGELARACLPLDERPERSSLGVDVLPRARVAYAVVAGAYPDARRARPGLEGWMAERRWARRGPVREIYLVDPGAALDVDALACEVQIPW